MQKHRCSRCRATKINTHTPRWAQCGKTGSPLPPAIPPSLRQWENSVETEWDMTGFIPRPHLFAAHANIGRRRVSFESEPEARWLAHLFLPSCFILKVDVTSLGYVLPSLKWSEPKVSFSPPHYISSSPKEKMSILSQIFDRKISDWIFQTHTGVTFELQLRAAGVASCCERYD